jgi:DNA-binding NtrC family response regulator
MMRTLTERAGLGHNTYNAARRLMSTTAPESASPEPVLIVEDDEAQRRGLQQLVRSWGFEAHVASDGEEALARIEELHPTIVLTDLLMPRMGGLDLLRAIRQQDEPDVAVVLMTAQGTVESAVEALKLGAYDYVTKPVDTRKLRILLGQLAERHGMQREMRVLRRQLRERGSFGRMIGASPAMRRIYLTMEQAAPTNASVLISGESGTGKELVAQTIHQLSPRANQPFVPVNCAAIPDTLLESELFGHEKGAFTGAIARRAGCFELADRGTLFLDEIAEMTPTTQAKLLRVLQERSFRTLGGTREQSVDIRVIAATNVDPQEAVRQGKLREDLFYRLNVFPIVLPPLRERDGDIALLAQAFVEEFGLRNGRSIAGVTDAARRLLERHRWPGNVRELRNVIERATIICQGSMIDVVDLPSLSAPAPVSEAPVEGGLVPGTTVDEAERRLIEVTLRHTGGNKTRAAELLGISLKTLHNKLNRMKEDAPN